MNKIDLHVHTVPTIRDASFVFSLHKLEEYVAQAGLHAVAITNHDVFDAQQFRQIEAALDVVVLPGIEVSLDCGHVLVIGDRTGFDDFEAKTDRVKATITTLDDSISIDDLEEIFGDLADYLVIPHCQKDPAVKGDKLDRISSYASAGEVDSAKKFIRAIKDDKSPTPVLFSDARICEELNELPTRQTFIDCGELTLSAIKSCLRDKRKVALSQTDGNKLFQVFNDGQQLSTGLNVLLGERSSGKTYTLNRIHDLNDNVKYIRQFSLVQKDEEANEREFNSQLQRNQSQFVEGYLSDFKSVLDDVMSVDLRANTRAVESYVASLLRSAEEADRRDAFSRMVLFDESEFSISEDVVLDDLFNSVRQVVENVEYREIIDKHIDRDSLKRLACELIVLLWEKAFEKRKKKLVNGLVRDIKQSLKIRTSAVQVDDVDLYRVCIEQKKVDRFSEIVKRLQTAATIAEESIQAFKMVARKRAFAGAMEVKKVSRVKAKFADAFRHYGEPYLYLQELQNNELLTRSELYKLFTNVSYSILNSDGFEVSGGERSEFRLLQEINEAQNYDILLIDEPESSFDNIFLKSDVNQVIREISLSMPVVVVTHNSTVGASIGADYLLYASKEVVGGEVVYKLYSGYPTDRKLASTGGDTASCHETMLNSLEAGSGAYEDRRRVYEAIRD